MGMARSGISSRPAPPLQRRPGLQACTGHCDSKAPPGRFVFQLSDEEVEAANNDQSIFPNIESGAQ
jgi:hypothetical protein